MSGFEVVGVVLGVIPLVVSALEHYSDGIATMKSMKEYEYVFADIHSSFAASVVIYKESCYVLLSQLSLPDNQMKDLLEDRNDDAWNDSNLRTSLQKRLGANSRIYLALVEKLNRRILMLCKKLKLGEDLRPPWVATDGTVDEISRQKFFKSTWMRIRGGFISSGCATLLEKLDQDIYKISQLISSASRLEPIQAEKKRRMNSSSWKNVRDQAQRVFKSLSSQFSSCSCQQPHRANLRLNVQQGQNTKEEMVRFEFLFTFQKDACQPTSLPWDWRNVEIESMECATTPIPFVSKPGSITPAPKKTARFAPSVTITSSNTPRAPPLLSSKIDDLCATLKQQAQSKHCIGFLDDQPWQHNIYCLPELSTPSQIIGSTSLNEILSEAKKTSFATREKCVLALILALTVLQLHDTPWLSRRWDTKDIYFVQTKPEASFTDHLYVSSSFSSSASALPSSSTSSQPRHINLVKSPTVFALGVALLELSWGCTLLSLATTQDLNEEGKVDSMTEFSIATRLADEILLRELPNYAKAAARCIRCSFDTFAVDFSDGEFRQRYYEGVVVPLLEDYEYATGIGVRI